MSSVTAAAGTGFSPAVPAKPMMLAPDSWQAKLIRKAEILHALGKPCILIVRLGDCTPNWLRTVNEGSG